MVGVGNHQHPPRAVLGHRAYRRPAVRPLLHRNDGILPHATFYQVALPDGRLSKRIAREFPAAGEYSLPWLPDFCCVVEARRKLPRWDAVVLCRAEDKQGVDKRGIVADTAGGVAEDARGVAEHHEQENLHANNDIMWQL